jgi:hypothetical protein
MQRIQNLTERLITLPPFRDLYDPIKLIPGENLIPDGYLDSLRDPKQGEPDHRLYLEELIGCTRVNRRGVEIEFKPQIKEVSAGAKKLSAEPDTLVDRPEEVAKAFIDVCADAKALKKWRKKEGRPGVLAAIDSRLDELEA